MPPLETSNRRQKAVLWMSNGRDHHGRYKVDAAVQINVRWEDNEREVQDGQGGTITIAATLIVDQEIKPGSVLYKGTLLAYNTLIAAGTEVYYSRAVMYSEIPDLKGRHPRRTLLLTKQSKALPTTA